MVNAVRQRWMRGENLVRIDAALLQVAEHGAESAWGVAGHCGERTAALVGGELGLRIEAFFKQRGSNLADSDVELLQLGIYLAHVAARLGGQTGGAAEKL